MNYDVSIVIPVYNGEKYIQRCFKSIQNQELKNIEVIFINDGSIDNSKSILDEIDLEYENTRVVHQNNKGPGAARNLGIEISRGEYIGFIDVDDCIEDDMYIKLFEKAKEHDLDVVVCGQKVIDSNGNIKQIILPEYDEDIYKNKNEIKENILKRILNNGPELLASQCNKIYRKSIIDIHNIRIPENRLFGEDWFFNQLILGKIEKIGFINEALYKYIRSNFNSLSSIYLHDAFDIFIQSYEFKKERMKEWGLSDKKYELLENKNFCNIIYNRVIINEMNKENNNSIIKKYNNIKNYVFNEKVQYAANNSNSSIYSRLYSHKRVLVIFILAYFDENIRPYLSKIKKIIT